MQVWSIWSLQSGTSTSSTHDAWKSRRSKQSTRCYCRLFAWLHSPPLWLLPNHALEDASVLAHSQFKGCVAPCSYRSTVWKCVNVIVSCQTVRVYIYILCNPKENTSANWWGCLRAAWDWPHTSCFLTIRVSSNIGKPLCLFTKRTAYLNLQTVTNCGSCGTLKRLSSALSGPQSSRKCFEASSWQHPKLREIPKHPLADYPRYYPTTSYWEKLTVWGGISLIPFLLFLWVSLWRPAGR